MSLNVLYAIFGSVDNDVSNVVPAISSAILARYFLQFSVEVSLMYLYVGLLCAGLAFFRLINTGKWSDISAKYIQDVVLILSDLRCENIWSYNLPKCGLSGVIYTCCVY